MLQVKGLRAVIDTRTTDCTCEVGFARLTALYKAFPPSCDTSTGDLEDSSCAGSRSPDNSGKGTIQGVLLWP